MSQPHRIELRREARFARAPGVSLKRVGQAAALYVGRQRAIHVLNPTAELLYRCLETPRSFGELAALMAELTEGSREAIEADLREFLPELLRLRVVTRVA